MFGKGGMVHWEQPKYNSVNINVGYQLHKGKEFTLEIAVNQHISASVIMLTHTTYLPYLFKH